MSVPVSPSIPPHPLGFRIFVLYVFVSISVLQIRSSIPFFLGEGNGNPLQHSCLENPMGRGAWWATYGHTESDTTEAT